jgi:hypothetical protein
MSGGLISVETTRQVSSFQVASSLTFLAPPGPAGASWPGMPAAQTELFGGDYNEAIWKSPDSGNLFPNAVQIDVGNTKLCVVVITPGAAGSTLKAQIFNGVIWEDCSLPVPIDIVGTQVSLPFPGIFNFPSDITIGGYYLLRIVGQGGDGATTPVFGTISLAISSQFVSIGG